jgi:hypothetical protein
MDMNIPIKYLCHKTEYILYTDSEMWPFYAREEPKGPLTSTIIGLPARSSVENRARSIVMEKVHSRVAAG